MLPFSSIGEKFEDVVRYMATYISITLFSLMEVLVFPAPFDGLQNVPFLIITVYFWSMYRPNVLPPLLVFILGILADIITGAPIGVGAIILVLLNWAVSTQRAFLTAQSFLMVWVIFATLYLGIVLIQWFVFGLVNFAWSSIGYVLPQFIAGLVAFPFITAIYHLANKLLPSQNFTLTSR